MPFSFLPPLTYGHAWPAGLHRTSRWRCALRGREKNGVGKIGSESNCSATRRRFPADGRAVGEFPAWGTALGEPGKVQEVLAFVFVELQGPGNCFDDFAGRAGDLARFERGDRRIPLS